MTPELTPTTELDSPTPPVDAAPGLGEPIPQVTREEVAGIRLGDELFPDVDDLDDEPALEELVVDGVPAVEVVIDRPDVVVTCRWYDAWSAPTSAEMAQLLQQVAARDPESGWFLASSRGAVVDVARDDDAQLRELRDAALRWYVMVRDASRCRFCGTAVAFGTDKIFFGGLPHGTLVHMSPGVVKGAANIVVACVACGKTQRRLHSEGQPGLLLMPCPTRPEHAVAVAPPTVPAPLGFQIPSPPPGRPRTH